MLILNPQMFRLRYEVRWIKNIKLKVSTRNPSQVNVELRKPAMSHSGSSLAHDTRQG